MEQQLHTKSVASDWRSRKLPAILAGDVVAAGISATFISPIITAIDRAVVENATSSRHPLLSTLKSHILCSFRHPRLFFAAKPFLYVWTLYAATYTTANTVESIGKRFTSKADDIFVSSVTFLSTCIVNVPLGVCKDVCFVQLYGIPNTSTTPLVAKAAAATVTQSPPSRAAKVPRIVGATFLFRDAITIFGSINLPPMLSPLLSDAYFAHPALKMAALQLFVPVLSQVVATPVHLLALDFYNRPGHEGAAERASRIRKGLGPTTVMRCSRIIPAFGVGLIANTRLREYFHTKLGAT